MVHLSTFQAFVQINNYLDLIGIFGFNEKC